MSFSETLILGICIAGTTALLGWLGQFLVAHLQRRTEKARYFREKLLERYSEFVALASAEVERARTIEAGMALRGRDENCSDLVKIEEQRHSLRLDLLRVSLQVKLFETDESLTKKVWLLAKSQPFMAFPFPPKHGEGNYNERFDKYKLEVDTYEKSLTALVDDVLKTHSAKQRGLGI